MERHINREGTSCPIPSTGSQGVPTLAPACKLYCQRRLWLAACPCLDSWFSALCLNLTAWLSRGLLPVTHLLDLTALTCCHLCLLITTWHLVKAHGVTRTEPKIHIICYITLWQYLKMRLGNCYVLGKGIK